MRAQTDQRELFGGTPGVPDGLVYQPDFLTTEEEQSLIAHIQTLPLEEARYRMFTAKRRILSFGAGYDFQTNALLPAPPLPPFLFPFRERVARWTGIPTTKFEQCTIAEYGSGTQLGWHRDVPRFGAVAGVSLGSTARMRLRPYPHRRNSKDRALVLLLEPRSAYVLRDDALALAACHLADEGVALLDHVSNDAARVSRASARASGRDGVAPAHRARDSAGICRAG